MPLPLPYLAFPFVIHPNRAFARPHECGGCSSDRSLTPFPIIWRPFRFQGIPCPPARVRELDIGMLWSATVFAVGAVLATAPSRRRSAGGESSEAEISVDLRVWVKRIVSGLPLCQARAYRCRIAGGCSHRTACANHTPALRRRRSYLRMMMSTQYRRRRDEYKKDDRGICRNKCAVNLAYPWSSINRPSCE